MKFLPILLLTFLCACGSQFEAYPITGNYYLTRMVGFPEIMYKTGKNHYSGLKIHVIVAAIGHDDKYIWSIHQETPEESPEYYIIPVQNNDSEHPENNKIGPLSEADFKNKMASLGYQEITFNALDTYK